MATNSHANGEPSQAASAKTDSLGHVLVSLWEDYEKAKDADLPQDQTDILEKIMQKAKSERLYWDYSCASIEWYDVVRHRNWKLQDSSKTRIMSEIAELDCPILTYTVKFFFRDLEDAGGFILEIQTRADALRKSVNRGFYTALYGFAPKFLSDCIANDYEYLLWALGIYGRGNYESAKMAMELLEKEIEGKYPSVAYLEFIYVLRKHPYNSEEPEIIPLLFNGGGFPYYYDDYVIGDEDVNPKTEARRVALIEYSRKYAGKAIALLSDQQIIIDSFHDLERDDLKENNSTRSEKYKTLRTALEALKERRESFGGEEAEVASATYQIKELIEHLDAHNIGVSAKDGVISVHAQNVDAVQLYFFKGERELWNVELKNPIRSYFCTDTITYNIPPCDDGDYTVICIADKQVVKEQYKMRSISVANRRINSGWGIYIADYKTGRPIEVADLIISHDSRVVCELRNFKFNGFTSIQWALDHVANEEIREYDLRCSYMDDDGYKRVSDDFSFWVRTGEKAIEEVEKPKLRAEIFTDRAAFNPGDSIQFKSLVYYDMLDGNLVVAKETYLDVTLYDPNRKIVDMEDFETNEFGTIAGSLNLPKDCKGGTYKLVVMGDGDELSSTSLTVDEFVLPAYDLVFDKNNCLYFSGDTVSVRGKLTSYSGHSLSSVKVAYEIWSNDDEELKTLTGDVLTDVDGQFNINFVADGDASQSRDYHIKVKATALNGETWEWAKVLTVNPIATMFINLANAAEGKAYNVSNIMSSPVAKLKFALYIPDLEILPKIPVNYTISRYGVDVLTGTAVSDQIESIDFSNLPSGIYKISAEAEYITVRNRKIKFLAKYALLKTSDDDENIVDGLEFFYKKLGDGRIGVQFGTSDEERWFVVEAYNSNEELLNSEVICLGTAYKTVRVFDMEYKSDYTDAMLVKIFSFKDSNSRCESFSFKRPKQEPILPLSFASFTDKTLPHTEYMMTLQTGRDAEAVVSIFDKASETIRPNIWTKIRSSYSTSFDVHIYTYYGQKLIKRSIIRRKYDSRGPFWDNNGNVPLFQSSYDYHYIESHETRVLLANRVYREREMADDMVYESPMMMDESVESDIDTSDVQVRDGMDHSTVFLPFLRSHKDGKIEFNFTTSDRASTYIVSVFAHDKDMKNAVLRREMVVSLPLELSVAQPQFLYEGDVYRLRATVFNSDEKAFEGNMVLEVYDTEDYKNAAPVAEYSHALTVGGRNAAMAEFELDVPQGVSVLGLKVAYIGTEMDDCSVADADASSAAKPTVSDAIFISIPVKVPTQTVTEAHSAVISGDADIEAAKAALAAEFTGTDATGAEYSEISLIDMLTKAIPAEIKSEGKDVLSRSQKFYAGRMAEYLAKRAGVKIPVTDNPMTLIDKILSCRNSDGGFGWFEGFKSSPIITAVILEEFATLAERGLLSDKVSAKMGPVLEAAVKYLDNKQLEDYPLWGGALSTEQYLRVRTMYPNVEFNPVIPKTASVETGGSGSKTASADEKGKTAKKKDSLAEFQKDVKNYLLPKKKSSLNGCILSKGRRILVSSVLASKEGAALARAWGLSSSVGELAKSVDADLISLSQYAVEHRSGGVYYPNAVLPFRGLLESEAYAHAFLCGLMEKFADKDAEYHRIAEGIRLWLMIQKETQQWDDDPSFLDAICMVLDGSDKTLNTRIVVLTKQYSKPLSEIKAAGNGFTVERKFYRNKVELKEGDVLNVGDKVIAEYHVWNEENRSFVRLETPRYAAFRPVEQLSGYVGTLARFILYVGFGCYYPSAYREVKADRTILYFDVLAEENSTFTEEFYVTQAGTFATPAVTVESAYAPHYRANDKAAFAITVE